ncbi:MAG: nickel pincer cofactor biosynthesis protein LarC [Tannerellaceae bacterium]|jgi:uncharacterized protein (TIGR00299 family) protein|nr:nickel pincer cofactor biosynthesis protein LarC [Tannerellaceae bacterium]
MKILYFDCFSGISGDMTLSAFIDLGVKPEQLVGELKKLPLKGWELRVSDVSKHGIKAKHVDVITDEKSHVHKGIHLFRHHLHSHEHRTMADIAALIAGSEISAKAKDLAEKIFMRLAVAEAKVHDTTPDKVHFHEVGAVDSIIDIVGAAICIDILRPDRIYASILHDGYGFVNCQHGKIPVPVPAVVEVLAAREVRVKQLDIEGEMMTPTGAAIVAELAENFGSMPEMKVLKTGYGAGTKEFPVPNLLRLFMGETSHDRHDGYNHTCTVVETNIDDTTPEILGYVMEKLFDAGARDVFFTPIYMKKCRPATRINIMCDDDKVLAMEHILFTETSTIGVRKYLVWRTCLPRRAVTIATPYGEVQAKESIYGDTRRVSIEFDDAHRLAKEKGVPLKEILFYVSTPNGIQ